MTSRRARRRVQGCVLAKLAAATGTWRYRDDRNVLVAPEGGRVMRLGEQDSAIG